jgi:hypothetical protein
LDETTKGIEMMLHFRQGEEHVYAFSTVADPHLSYKWQEGGFAVREGFESALEVGEKI